MIAKVAPHWIRDFFRDENYRRNLSFFKEIPLFQGLSTREVGRVVLSMQRRAYQAGEVLFEEGQIGKAVFIIKSGRVELSRRQPGGSVRSLSLLSAGQMFGEMALLEENQRTATAAMLEDGEIFLLYASTLDTLVRRFPRIGSVLMRNMAALLSILLRRANKELDQRPQVSA